MITNRRLCPIMAYTTAMIGTTQCNSLRNHYDVHKQRVCVLGFLFSRGVAVDITKMISDRGKQRVINKAPFIRLFMSPTSFETLLSQ